MYKKIHFLKLKKLLFLTFLLLFVFNVEAKREIVFEKLHADNNLPEGAVNQIVQDDVGFLWVGTWKGLYRYDGYQFENFASINPAFDALKISQLLINGSDLWVGTFVTGLIRIDLNTYEITVYNTSAKHEQQISDDNIISLCALPDNSIAAGTERGGFSIIGADYNVAELFKADRTDILNNPQVSAIEVHNDSLLALGNNSFLLFNINSSKVESIDHPAINYHIGGINTISENEFLVFNNQELLYLNIEGDKPRLKTILKASVKLVMRKDEINPHLFYVVAGNQIYEYNHSTSTIHSIFDESNQSISKIEINTILVTHDNVKIIGTERGLFKLVNKSKVFGNYSTPKSDNEIDIVSNIIKAGDELYAGTWGKGILKLNEEMQILEPLEFQNHGLFSTRFIFSMRTIGNDIWFSTKNQLGVYRFPHTSEPYTLKHYPVVKGSDSSDQYYTITAIYESENNGILLGTWEGFILKYDESRDCFETLTENDGTEPLSKNLSINSIAEDNEGNTWLAISGGGVLKMKIASNSIVSQEILTTHNGLSSNFATSIYQSRNNRIWIGTEAGLNIYENEEITSLYSRDMVFDVQSIVEDPIGYLWLGTERGLVRVNSNNTDDPLKIFDHTDGLKNRSFFLNSVYGGSDYTFYFGGYNGIDFFTPYKIDYNYNKPIPRITRLSVFNEAVYPASEGESILDENIFNANIIHLKHNQNTFSFTFSNLEYQVQEKSQFAFMLEGVDIDWNYQGSSQRLAYYTRISPGTYTFYLRSTNNDGVWSDTPLQLSVVISPPFWASTLAYIIYFIMAMVSLFLIIHTRVIKVQQKHKQKLKEIEYKKQKELNELKTSFFTNISHEFRTPLTLILGPLAQILENEKSDPYKDSHLTIFRNASRLLHLTNRILDFQKNENTQLKLQVEPVLVSDFAYNIFLFFNYEAQKRNIDYQYKTSHDETVYIDTECVESILFNLLSNAFKYTPDKRSISVTVYAANEKIQIKVTDTGMGIEEHELKNIFTRFYSLTNRNSTGIGLSLSQRLAKLHKGTITVESTPGRGSKFILQLPLADVYSNEEKIVSSKQPNVIDWKKADLGVQKSISNNLDKLKTTFEKDQLLALVVDDNFEIRQFIKSLLDNKFKVLEAGNGRIAFELAKEHIPDIIISDVMMPEMDGFELCTQLKTEAKTDHIPVILTTVLSEQSDRIKGLTRGADSYIPKPIDPDHLLIRVNKLIEKQLRLKEKFNLGEHVSSPNEPEKPELKVHPIIEKARSIVLDNIDNSEYNIDDFCSDLGMSRMQLYRKFKAISGMSANSFIRKVRLHQAAKMLQNGNYSIKEVTYDVGFIDLKYFRKCFNDEFGVNPSDYAKMHNENSSGI